MNRQGAEFFFDYLSPYAYLAWKRVKAWLSSPPSDVRWHAVPIVFGAVLHHHGQLGPAEIPSKRVFTFEDVIRRAHDAELPLRPPLTHPFNPIAALRVSSSLVCGSEQSRVIDTLFDAAWGCGERVEMGDPSVIANLLSAAGLPGDELVARTKEREAKERLRFATERAIELGVFGVPSFQVGGKLFFGQDRIDDVQRFLRGEDPVEDSTLQAFSGMTASKTRTR